MYLTKDPEVTALDKLADAATYVQTAARVDPFLRNASDAVLARTYLARVSPEAVLALIQAVRKLQHAIAFDLAMYGDTETVISRRALERELHTALAPVVNVTAPELNGAA